MHNVQWGCIHNWGWGLWVKIVIFPIWMVRAIIHYTYAHAGTEYVKRAVALYIPLGSTEGTFCIVLTTLNKRCEMYAQLSGVKPTDVPDWHLIWEHKHTHTHTQSHAIMYLSLHPETWTHFNPLNAVSFWYTVEFSMRSLGPRNFVCYIR